MTVTYKQTTEHDPTTKPSMRAFYGMSYAFVIAMIGTTLPTPLYPIYQGQWGLSGFTITIIFATYAIGVLAALLTLGSWSDKLGRKPVLLTGIVAGAISAVMFLLAQHLPLLLIGRLFSGLSAGIFTGAGTVAVIELAAPSKRGLATLVATAVNMGGLGLGPLLAGLLSEYAFWPLRLAFIVNLILLVPAFVAVWRMPETVDVLSKPALRIQRLQVPSQVRQAFIPAVIAGFAGFAVFGFFSAVAPTMLGELLNKHNHALIGLIVCLLFIASPLGQASAGKMYARRALQWGCVILTIGVVLVGSAIASLSLTQLMLGAIVVGLGQGMAFRAGMARITEDSPADQRGAITSTFFVILYIAISLPTVAIGAFNQWFGIQATGIGFAIIACLLTLCALFILIVRKPKSSV